MVVALATLLFLLFVCLAAQVEINFYTVLMRVFIYFIIFFLLSCSEKQDPGDVVYARVGTNTLTNNSLSPDPKKSNSETVPLFVENWINQTVFLSAAKERGLEKDTSLIKKRDSYYEQLLISSFIESEGTSKTQVSSKEVRDYYDKNRDHFVRSQDMVFVEQYITTNKKEARGVVSALRKNTKINNEIIKRTTSGHIKKGVFSKKIDNRLFSGVKEIVGPFVLGGDVVVLRVLNRYKKGTQRGLEEVYDEIYQRIFKTKMSKERASLLDSLKKTMNIYINPKYQ
jgi:hypothetical protein